MYKLELPKKWKMYNVFHVLLLKQHNTKKEWVNKKAIELYAGNNKKYNIEAICNNAIYARKSKSSHLPELHYLVLWKHYLEEKNTWKPVLAIEYLRKLISLFHKNHLDKQIAICEAIDIALPMARPTIRLTITGKLSNK